MHNIFYTPQAQKDLADIRDFIEKNDPEIAIKVIETIFFYINNLSLFPHIGKQSNSQLWCREIIEPTFRYRIIYEYDGTHVRVVAIFKYKNM
ncbi:MAG: hypothetical protein ACD_80C00089G0010 [uncultured bacterium (gcode 4)]|uniref:Plasmid stabilization system n=1 Tax=uncultured bacterium (gcode 4) TaxID=1234023 RepID=K1XJB2_9BACT|nr:MAG: hypothetical protein ACD_80C00089G0010 [uncultured bacterium (gcode 4)]